MTTGGQSRRIAWRCSICGRRIANGAGWITINSQELNTCLSASLAWREAHPGPLLSGTELSELPDPAHWRVLHRRCDPEPEDNGYWFDIERARTVRQLLGWTAHLMGKSWLEYTDWQNFIAKVAYGWDGDG
jgi:hypothetical protein